MFGIIPASPRSTYGKGPACRTPTRTNPTPMKFTRELPSSLNLIRSYESDGIRIGERWLRAGFLVSANELIADWPVSSVSALRPEHFLAAFAWQPEIILLGTGTRQVFPARDTHTAIVARGIGFEVMDTGAACRTYNVLVSEQRRVAAGFIF